MKITGDTVLICPNCGEDNSPAFRFCGMCGTALESRPVASGSTFASAPGPARISEPRKLDPIDPRPRPAIDPKPPVASPAAKPVRNSGTTIAGPSLLGLSTPDNDASLDKLRDQSFAGISSYYEPEESDHSGRRILLLLMLLTALGVAGWWTYHNYLGTINHITPSATSTPPAEQAPPTTAAKSQPSPEPPASPANSPQAQSSTTTAASEPASQSQPASTPAPQQPAPQQKEANPAPAAQARPARQAAVPPAPKPAAETRASRQKPKPTEIAVATSAAPVSADKGDAEYKKGESYLYGRGVGENCGEAVKFLKQAAAKESAKARSAFGTMYATGHCVPRDLPTSYGWFALALRVDPNNQILEKDLTAVWNQMTPPERESATKFKP